MITKLDQFHTTYDWYLKDNNGHISYMYNSGGLLPESVSISRPDLETLWKYFRHEIDSISTENIVHIGQEFFDDEWFTSIVNKGIFLCDNIDFVDTDINKYKVVGAPLQKLKFDDLPTLIQNILVRTSWSGAFNQNVEISVSDIK